MLNNIAKHGFVSFLGGEASWVISPENQKEKTGTQWLVSLTYGRVVRDTWIPRQVGEVDVKGPEVKKRKAGSPARCLLYAAVRRLVG